MIVIVASHKGGVAKTTTAIHVADYLHRFAPTLLVDCMPNRSATIWHHRGKLRFPIVGEEQLAREAGNYEHLAPVMCAMGVEHIVADISAKDDKIKDLVVGADVIIVPATPDFLALKATSLTAEAIRGVGGKHFQVLLTIVPPAPSRDGEEACEAIKEMGLPLFNTWIRSSAAFERAVQIGCVVGEVSGDPHAADGAADYQALGEEIHKARMA